jgi:hypothetical protein
MSGDKKGPAKFSSTFYTGGKLDISGWDMPVVVDLAALKEAKVLVANLDHDQSKRVGNFTVANDGKTLVANGTATAKTAARDEVIESALDGYQWQSSLEVNPSKVTEVKAGKSVTVNGQEHEGPVYVVAGTLKGFGFVSHGADDNTTATIAASAASTKGNVMDAACKKWIEDLGFDVDTISEDQRTNLEANFKGQNGKTKAKKAGDPYSEMKAEGQRRKEIHAVAKRWIEIHDKEDDVDFIGSVEKCVDHAIEAGIDAKEFRGDLYESSFPLARTVSAPRERGVGDRALMASICEANRLPNLDKHFTDQELQAGRDHYPHGIGPAELLLLGAEARGYRRTGSRQVTREVLECAFARTTDGRTIRASGGFSTIDVANITGAVANKFVMEGWNAVDQTCLRIAKITPVRNFHTITTVSLTDSLRYEQIGADGEIKHGTLDELTYTNQADTYAKMLAITRKDIINDDVSAFASVPRKLGNGAIKLLNHIFWTEFLGAVTANFFGSGNSNINTGVADMSLGGLDATETVFMNQTNPDGTPLALMPRILLVPTALKNKALTLMGSQLNALAITSYATGTGDANPFAGRFRVESSPYISVSSYTGSTSTAWWMLADPNELAVISIAALNGRVEPTVDSAEADFNTLGIQWRGYSDVGVNLQEYRAGVHADGTT